MANTNSGLLFGQPVERIIDFRSYVDQNQYEPGPTVDLIDQLALKLNCPYATAKQVFEGLQNQGYIDVKHRFSLEKEFWFIYKTEKAEALLKEPSFKALTRQEADTLLLNFLNRTKEVNEDDEFLYRILSVKVFGSYLSKKKILKDLDVCISFECKIRGEGISPQTFKKMYADVVRNAPIKTYYNKHFAPLGEVIEHVMMQETTLDLYIEPAADLLEKVEWTEVYRYSAN